MIFTIHLHHFLAEFESEQENSFAEVLWFILLPGTDCHLYSY